LAKFVFGKWKKWLKPKFLGNLGKGVNFVCSNKTKFSFQGPGKTKETLRKSSQLKFLGMEWKALIQRKPKKWKLIGS